MDTLERSDVVKTVVREVSMIDRLLILDVSY